MIINLGGNYAYKTIIFFMFFGLDIAVIFFVWDF